MALPARYYLFFVLWFLNFPPKQKREKETSEKAEKHFLVRHNNNVEIGGTSREKHLFARRPWALGGRSRNLLRQTRNKFSFSRKTRRRENLIPLKDFKMEKVFDDERIHLMPCWWCKPRNIFRSILRFYARTAWNGISELTRLEDGERKKFCGPFYLLASTEL